MKTSDEIFEKAEQLAVSAVNDESLIHEFVDANEEAKTLEGSQTIRGSKYMTQTEKILKHIKETGSITQREAYIDYGIQSFHRRLSDLREQGIEFIGESKKHKITGAEYTRYTLMG